MITTTTSTNHTIMELRFIELIKLHLQGVQQQSLSQLGKKLFPIMSQNNIWASLYNCFHTFFTIRKNKGENFDDGSKMILKYAQDMKDQLILPKVKNLLEDQEFAVKLEDMIAKELDERKLGGGMGMGMTGNNNISGSRVNNLNNGQLQQQHQNSNLNNNRTISNNMNTQGQGNNLSMKRNPQQQNQQQHGQKNNIPSNMNNIVDISDDSPTERQSMSNNNNNKIQIMTGNNGHQFNTNTSNNNFTSSSSSDPYDVPNLSQRQVCLCGKSCQMMQPKKDLVFKCCHCHLYYHIQCMQRGKSNINQTDPIKKLVSCAYCHLKQLVPMKQVMKTLFTGVLKQGRKRHQIIFNLDMMDLKTKKWRIQVRCFRLKDKIQTFTLFPDSASFSINNRFEKQFLPLPKQSSLKYRKDQPFLLTQHLINHENKLTIIERIPKKESRDDRIEPENHLLGIYLVEDKAVASLVKEVKLQNAFTFYQSKAMLDRCLRIGDAQDITCQVLKIPIICTLTIQRIKTPVRGIFCSHFQCFDLNNFLILTSTSANPRWLCPLCKQPAYNFKYDVIIGSIIQQFSKNQPTQIMFTKDGEFKVYSNEDVCPGMYTNINDLPIDMKFKRQLQNPLTEEQVTRQAEMVSDVEEHKVESDVISNNNNNVSNGGSSNKIMVGQNGSNGLKSNGSNGLIVGNNGSNNGSNESINNNNNTNNNTTMKQKKPYNNTSQQQSQQPQKTFQMPQNANIISLDDD